MSMFRSTSSYPDFGERRLKKKLMRRNLREGGEVKKQMIIICIERGKRRFEED